MDRLRFSLLIACALVSPALAENQLEITIRWSDGRSNTHTQAVSDDDGRDIASRPDTVGGKYLVVARKKLAERQGYSAAIYGPDFWKIPQVSKWHFELRDPSSNRVLASNRP